MRQGKGLRETENPNKSTQNNTAAASTDDTLTAKPKKLSYKLQRELDALPEQIGQLEHAIAELQQQMSEPEFYQQDFSITQPVMDEIASKQAKLDRMLERWVELEGWYL